MLVVRTHAVWEIYSPETSPPGRILSLYPEIHRAKRIGYPRRVAGAFFRGFPRSLGRRQEPCNPAKLEGVILCEVLIPRAFASGPEPGGARSGIRSMDQTNG